MVDRKKSDEKDDVKDGIAEFKILSMLKHKHIVKVLHAEENERRVCLVLEYAAKGDLTAHIRSQPAFAPPASSSSSPSHSQPLIRRRNSLGTSPPIATRRKSGPTQRACYEEGEARRMFKQLLSAVHYTHLQGYVHRDIKPENVLVDKDNNVLLCDFSLATTWNPRLTRAGSCGTLHYAAPGIVFYSLFPFPFLFRFVVLFSVADISILFSLLCGHRGAGGKELYRTRGGYLVMRRCVVFYVERGTTIPSTQRSRGCAKYQEGKKEGAKQESRIASGAKLGR